MTLAWHLFLVTVAVSSGNYFSFFFLSVFKFGLHRSGLGNILFVEPEQPRTHPPGFLLLFSEMDLFLLSRCW